MLVTAATEGWMIRGFAGGRAVTIPLILEDKCHNLHTPRRASCPIRGIPERLGRHSAGSSAAGMAATNAVSPPSEPDRSRARALTLLGEVLSSKVRASLLGWVVPRLDTGFSLTELSRDLGAPISSLQHECYKLERLGVLKGRREGASRRYHVQLDHHLSRPLISLVIATLGLETVLREAIADCGRVDVSVIAGPEPLSGSDLLVLAVIGNVNLEGLARAQRRVSMVLGIDPDRLELAYFQRENGERDDIAMHPLVQRLARRPIQPVTGAWPPTKGGVRDHD